MVAQLSDAVRAQCFALRQAGMKFTEICKVVKKKDRTHPTEGAVRELVKNFKLKGKKKAGRPTERWE